MVIQTTVIYITDNELDSMIAKVSRHYLLKAIGKLPLISVTQEPMDFGENICIGKIGRSGLNIDKQIKMGLEAAKTKFVAIAEHDNIYCPEHFNFMPPDDEYFYYNTNCWLLQYHSAAHPEYDGMFSFFFDRCVQSQLIASRESMMRAIDRKIEILSDPAVKEAWPIHTRLGEPGTNYLHRSRRVFGNLGLLKKWKLIKEYITTCNARRFETKTPTVDIRHGNNFTGGRRGTKRRWQLEPWGTMEQIFSKELIHGTSLRA